MARTDMMSVWTVDNHHTFNVLQTKLYSLLYTVLYTLLYTVLYYKLYCTINCTQTSKWLNEPTYSQRNTTLHASCKLNITLYSSMYWIIYCTLYCIIHCTLYCTLNLALYTKSKCMAELAKSLRYTFLPYLVYCCLTLYCTIFFN